jgi:signal transduction histidine kinase
MNSQQLYDFIFRSTADGILVADSENRLISLNPAAAAEALISAVAHDLRNPIAALGGYAELVAKFGELNDNQKRFTGRIQQTASKIDDLVAPLVDLAWIEAGLPLAHVYQNGGEQSQFAGGQPPPDHRHFDSGPYAINHGRS